MDTSRTHARTPRRRTRILDNSRRAKQLLSASFHLEKRFRHQSIHARSSQQNRPSLLPPPLLPSRVSRPSRRAHEKSTMRFSRLNLAGNIRRLSSKCSTSGRAQRETPLPVPLRCPIPHKRLLFPCLLHRHLLHSQVAFFPQVNHAARGAKQSRVLRSLPNQESSSSGRVALYPGGDT